MLLKFKIPIYYLLLFFISVFFPIYYGYIGIFPIDSFLIFNGGYNVLNGYHPFKDYWSITGPFLDYIQFIFFFLLDVNWLSYILHASFINLLLASISFYFFCRNNLEVEYSFLYSLSIGILAYPQTGTPFMDHHAFIFSFISILFLLLGLNFKKNIFWFCSGIFLFFSFFSKQIPSAYLVILYFTIFILFFSFFKKNYSKNILFFIYSLLFSSAIFFLMVFVNEIPIKNIINQYFFYPITVGKDRGDLLNFDLKNTIFQFKFLYFAIIPYLFIFNFIFKKNIQKIDKLKELLFLIYVLGTFLIFIYAQLMTLNQVLIFFTIPFYLGLSHIYNKKFFKKKFLSVFLILLLIFATGKFHLRFNEEKKFMELSNSNLDLAIDALPLSQSLKGLRWITPKFNKDPRKELNLLIQTKEILLGESQKFILITNYQIIPALIDLKEVSPNKWYDGFSVPKANNKFFNNYKDFFRNSVKKQNINVIYLIDKNQKYLDNMYENKKCIKYTQINQITLKANVEKCS